MINIPFQVDELRLKSFLYWNDGTEVATAYLTTNMINDDALCIIMDSREVHYPDASFILNKKSITGNFNFVVRQFDGALSAKVGELYLILEFIAYQ